MNKQNLILWSGAIFITFLAGYLKSVTGPNFPMSGTIGIEGQRITYHIERKAHLKDTLRLLIRTDISGVTGKVQVAGRDSAYQFTATPDSQFISACIPVASLPAKLLYSIILQYHGKNYPVPYNGEQFTTLCVPKVADSLQFVHFVTLYLGLVLTLRAALDKFGEGKRTKKLSLFALICFGLYGFFVVPVINFIELNAINRTVLQPQAMFYPLPLLLFFFGVASLIAIFTMKNSELPAWLFAAGTLLLFFFV
ncbi:MAG: hypothetical protein LWX56_02540 [Ignavibacteria bacterium]|nr:hypothetical protein [Ignavibacteria bacterium]